MLKLLILLIPTLICSEISNNDDQSGFVINLQVKGHGIPYLDQEAKTCCTCPIGYDCGLHAKCQRDFKMIAEFKDGTRQVATTTPLVLGSDCRHHQKSFEPHFGAFEMHLPTMPKSIHLALSKLGAITSKGEIAPLDNFTHNNDMDFPIPLEDVRISSTNRRRVFDTLHKDPLHQEGVLSVYFSINCLGSLTGQSCDLKCITPKNKSFFAHCVSVETGEFFKCKHVENGQVEQCENSLLPGKNDVMEKSDQVEKHLVQESIEWKTIAIVIGIVLLSAALGILLGFKISNRSEKNKEKKNNISVSYLTLSNL